MLTKQSAELTLFDKLSRLTFLRPRKFWAPKAPTSSLPAGSTISTSPPRSISIRMVPPHRGLCHRDAGLECGCTGPPRMALQRVRDAVRACGRRLLADSRREARARTRQRAARAQADRKLERGSAGGSALAEREERAGTEKMRLTSLAPQEMWTDYTVTNAASGKSYRVALRGWRPGESYCSCPDFARTPSAPASTSFTRSRRSGGASRTPCATGRTASATLPCTSPTVRRCSCGCFCRLDSTRKPTPSCAPSATRPSPTSRTCSNASGDSRGTATP